MEITKDVPIKWKNEDAIVVIKKMNFGDRNKLKKTAREVSWEGGKQKTVLDEEKYANYSLLLGIHKAPFNHTDMQVILALPGDVGEKLFEEIDNFNTLNPKKKQD